MGLNIPIFFSAGLTEKSLQYYKLFISWTSQSIKQTHVKSNAFDFKHITTFDREDLTKPGPCVLFATPGMLHAGMSLEAFKHWAPDPKNLLIIPGYCVVGTVGSRLTSGFKGPVEIDGRNTVNVRCGIAHVSFSAHADAKGIMQLLRQAEPENVMLVHGEKWKMGFLREKIQREFGIPCFDPPNGEYVTIHSQNTVPIKMSTALLDEAMMARRKATVVGFDDDDDVEMAHADKRPRKEGLNQIPVSGVLLMKDDASPAHFMRTPDAANAARIPQHFLTFSSEIPVPSGETTDRLIKRLQAYCSETCLVHTTDTHGVMQVKSVSIKQCSTTLSLKWSHEDADVADSLTACVKGTIDVRR